MKGRRGLFVTFEGCDGVGKSTHLRFVAQLLRDQEVLAEVSREPGGTYLGEKVRSILVDNSQGSLNSMSELLLILAARAQHLSEKIQPALDSGKWFLCDRFSDATYAYQGGGRGLEFAKIKEFEEMTGCALRPDVTFLFDANPEIGLSRAGIRGEQDRFESEDMDFYRRVRNVYLNLAKRNPEKWRLIDASKDIISIQEILKTEIDNLLSVWRDV